MKQSQNILALTMGDPGGIGPEISIKAWQSLKDQRGFSFVFIGCPALIEKTAENLNLDIQVQACDRLDEGPTVFSQAFPVLPVDGVRDVRVGESSPSHASSVIDSIKRAVELTYSGLASAVVTNPINKASLKAADFPFPGHTEYLAHMSDNAYPVMMLEGGGLRTVPLTRHIPLKNVPVHLDRTDIIKTAQIIHEDLRRFFNMASPRIAISGLNPHAGEGGVLGHEEDDIIKPAITELQAQGIEVIGPLPADTMFHERARAAYDVALCMYHDQALIPVKMIGFDTGVNITLGLDFIRTSPDHGTALDIAPNYEANPDSLIAALTCAAKMSAQRGRPDA